MSSLGGWTELGPHEAFTMGADLWIIADLADSAWARKIDWYLNFQLSRAAHHSRQDISDELASTAESWEFDPPVIASQADAPLLVASSKFLPNQMTVQISARGSAWVKAATSVVSRLRPRTVRVFLPSGLERSDFLKQWGGLEAPIAGQFTVVLEQGARSN